jgi:Alpha and gamma adaptin binding protein p34
MVDLCLYVVRYDSEIRVYLLIMTHFGFIVLRRMISIASTVLGFHNNLIDTKQLQQETYHRHIISSKESTVTNMSTIITTSTASNATSILRIGPSSNEDGAVTKLFKDALVSYFQNNSNPNEQEDAGGNNETNNDDAPKSDVLQLQNKYFTAQVELRDILQDDPSSSSAIKEDGVILVFDALASNPDNVPSSQDNNNNNNNATTTTTTTTTTFDSLTPIHQHAESNERCGDLLRLCVGVYFGGGTSTKTKPEEELRGTRSPEKEYSRRILWCLDRGYEYVEADISESALQVGHDVRDKEGFARIVEAIHGTVWSSAVLQQAKPKVLDLQAKLSQAKSALLLQQKDNTTATNATHTECGEEDETISNDDDVNDVNAYVPPDPSMLAMNLDRQKPTYEAASIDSAILLDPPSATAAAEESSTNDPAVEHVFDKMESLLQEANRIRAASKNGSMTDEERRERAGEAALALVNLMGALEDDDDDDYDDDEEDNQDEP